MTLILRTYYDHRAHQIILAMVISGNPRDRNTLEGYLRYQAIDPMTARLDELKEFRLAFEEVQEKKRMTPKRGPMKLRDLRPNEYRYAVAVREGSELFMTFFIRRDPKGDVYLMIPRGRGSGNPHASYHSNGRFHQKSYDRATTVSDRQSLTSFRGHEHLGMYGGHGPKSIGITCDPAKFTGIVEVPDDVLTDGFVAVDLVEPGCEDQIIDLGNPIVSTSIFKEAEPWLVIRVGTHARQDEAAVASDAS